MGDGLGNAAPKQLTREMGSKTGHLTPQCKIPVLVVINITGKELNIHDLKSILDSHRPEAASKWLLQNVTRPRREQEPLRRWLGSMLELRHLTLALI